MSFLAASSGNTLFGQDLWSSFKAFHPWGLYQVLQGLLLDLFQVLFTSGFTSFASKPVPQPPPFHVLLCIYIYILKNTYVHMHTYICIYFIYTHMYIKSIYSKQSSVSFSRSDQPKADTTAMQKSQQLQTSSFPTVSGRLRSKSLLVLIWDKGALSLFSRRVAMATWHKDISIAG